MEEVGTQYSVLSSQFSQKRRGQVGMAATGFSRGSEDRCAAALGQG